MVVGSLCQTRQSGVRVLCTCNTCEWRYKENRVISPQLLHQVFYLHELLAGGQQMHCMVAPHMQPLFLLQSPVSMACLLRRKTTDEHLFVTAYFGTMRHEIQRITVAQLVYFHAPAMSQWVAAAAYCAHLTVFERLSNTRPHHIRSSQRNKAVACTARKCAKQMTRNVHSLISK